MLEFLKFCVGGALLLGSMYVGSKCWSGFIKEDKTFKDLLKYFGWTVLYVFMLVILNSF
jgi:hypothetical protein